MTDHDDPVSGASPNVHGFPVPPFAEALLFEAVKQHLHARPRRLNQRATKRPRYVYEAAMPGGESVVIKVEHDTQGDDAIVLEAWATEQASARGVPAPRVLALDTSERIVPGRYAIFSRIPGRAMADRTSHYPLAPHVPDDQRRQLIDAGRALRPLHDIPVEGYGRLNDDVYLRTGEVRGVEAHWRDGTLDPAIEALLALVRHYAITSDEAVALRSLLARDEDIFDDPPVGRLLHGDFDTTHIFVDGQPPRVSGIIDFGDREAGDPIWDLATFELWEDHARLASVIEGYAPDRAMAGRIDRALPAYVLARLLRLAARRTEDGRRNDGAALLTRVREQYLTA